MSNSSEYRIREFEERDSRALAELEHLSPQGNLIRLSIDVPNFRTERLKLPSSWAYVIEHIPTGNIAGVGACDIGEYYVEGEWVRLGYIYCIRVHPDHQRRGLSARIMKELEATAVNDKGCAFVFLGVIEDNLPARLGYEKRGYQTQRRLKTLTWPLRGRPHPIDSDVTLLGDDETESVIKRLIGGLTDVALMPRVSVITSMDACRVFYCRDKETNSEALVGLFHSCRHKRITPIQYPVLMSWTIKIYNWFAWLLPALVDPIPDITQPFRYSEIWQVLYNGPCGKDLVPSVLRAAENEAMAEESALIVARIDPENDPEIEGLLPSWKVFDGPPLHLMCTPKQDGTGYAELGLGKPLFGNPLFV